MVNLSTCKSAQEALDKVALAYGYADIPATLIFHKSEITGIDMKFGEAILRWRKPRSEKE
jgi:hypothetical protein